MFKLPKKQSIISFVLTTFVIAILVLSGPASAIDVAINNLDNIDATPGSSPKTFEVVITVNSGEFLPIQYTDLIFSDESGDNTKNCRIESDNTDNCDFLTVNSRTISDLNNGYGYGYGYGYDMENGYGYQDFGYGYGYGYGDRGIITGSGSGTVTYSLTIDPEKFPGLFFGNSYTEARVYGGTSDNYAYFKGSTTFTVTSLESSTPVQADTGATITYGDVSITIPSNSLSTDTAITIQQVASTSAPTSSYIQLAGKVYDFGPDGTTFSTPITITLPYTEEDLSILGITDETKLQPAFYNTITGDWEVLYIVSRDTTANTITFEVTHFTQFGIVEDATPTAMSSDTTTDVGTSSGKGKSIPIINPKLPSAGIAGGCASGYELNDREVCVPIVEEEAEAEGEPSEIETGEGKEAEGGMQGITAAAVVGNITKNKPAAIIVITLIVLGLLGTFIFSGRRGRKLRRKIKWKTKGFKEDIMIFFLIHF